MRLWHIDPAYLDNKRLAAQNNECHGLLTCILKGQRWGQITEQFKHSIQYIKYVHDNVARELFIRYSKDEPEMEHQSPMEFSSNISMSFMSEHFSPSKDDYKNDILQLRGKWAREGYYYGTGRYDLRQLEVLYGLRPGPVEVEWKLQQEMTRAFWSLHRKQAPKKGTLGDRLDFFREKGLYPPKEWPVT